MESSKRSIRQVKGAVAMGMALLLAGCISLGAEVPDTLLTLSSETRAPAGASASAAFAEGTGADTSRAIAVLAPEVPAKLDVLRVPVNVSSTEIAYLPETFWVEKPARLFRALLGEALRSKASAGSTGSEAGGEAAIFVLDSDDTPLRAGTFLRGTLSEMSYDAPAREVVVRFDAVRSDGRGNAVSRRFEARESAISAEPAEIGPALNRAANEVANEVADWMME